MIEMLIKALENVKDEEGRKKIEDLIVKVACFEVDTHIESVKAALADDAIEREARHGIRL